MATTSESRSDTPSAASHTERVLRVEGTTLLAERFGVESLGDLPDTLDHARTGRLTRLSSRMYTRPLLTAERSE